MFGGARGVVWRASESWGLNRAIRRARRQSLLVLNYHGVVSGDSSRDPILYGNVMSVGEFSRQIAEVARLFHPIGASELLDWRTGRRSLPPNPALVTFDDGYRNNLTFAAPVLERYGIPAIINICTGYIGQKEILWPDEIHCRVLFWPERVIPMPSSRQQRNVPDSFVERKALAGYLREACKRLPPSHRAEYLHRLRQHPTPEPREEVHAFLSWDEVRTLKTRGFEIGSHTVTHPILTQLPPEDRRRELTDSKLQIEQQLGGSCKCFAYPNGGAADVSPAVVEEVRSAGYSFAFTVMGRLASLEDDALALDRVYIPAAVSAAEFLGRISGSHGALKSLVGGWRERLSRRLL
jgi:peptidoglycan/xylan/chitin deacetylase (PgdA/CDA1 family)